jgi:hypothetical protein
MRKIGGQFTGVSIIFETVPQSIASERASFLKINDINDISFLERLTVIIVVLYRKGLPAHTIGNSYALNSLLNS